MSINVVVMACRELRSCLRTEGFLRTINILHGRFLEWMFDLKFSTDTTSRVEMSDLDFEAPNKDKASRYQPTGIRTLPKMFENVKFSTNDVFVDYGCGKGRALLIASTYGFKKLIGIEFSPALCKIARNNILLFSEKNLISDIEIFQGDVLDYKLKGDETVFYFFYPFHDELMNVILDRILESLRTTPRTAWILFYLPRKYSFLNQLSEFSLIKEGVFGEYEGQVYQFKQKV